ncbi:MAG: hypothetical protein ABIN48_05035 [Ginsengibacter sp.]
MELKMNNEQQIISARKPPFGKPRVSRRLFTIDDLQILSGAIAIPSLTDKIVDESFAANITDKLELKGNCIDYVSLDDFGYIIIRFRKDSIGDKQIKDVLSALNGG